MNQAGHTSAGLQTVTRSFVVLAPVVTALAFGWWMLARRQYILIDDAYISFRYAVNFAQGHGLVWNVGVPVEGYTCLLWVVLLSGIARTGIDLTWAAVVLSALFGLACLELMRRIARAGRSVASLWDLVPGMLLASLPSFAHAMTSGMEESFFAFLCVLGVHLIIASRQRSSLRWSAALCFAAACLTRPEGVLVTAVAMSTELLLERARLRALITPCVCVVTVVLVHMAARLAYYGYPLPNTFYAKVIFGRTTVERGAAHFAVFALAGGWLLLLGLFRLRSSSRLRPWIVHGYALAATYCAYLLTVGGDHPHWNRFYIPLLPLPLLAVGEHIRDLAQSLIRDRLRWLAAPACVIGCSLFALVSLPFSEAYEPIVGVIDRPIKKLIDDVDLFFAEVPRDSFLAVAAIGYVGYRNMDLHILDTWGLTDAHIAHLKVKPTVKFGHDKQDIGYVASMKPDYVYVIAAAPALPIPGYDLCWPSDNSPAAVYRRALPLAPAENQLGLPSPRTRRIEPPPPCRPPAYLGPRP